MEAMNYGVAMLLGLLVGLQVWRNEVAYRKEVEKQLQEEIKDKLFWQRMYDKTNQPKT